MARAMSVLLRKLSGFSGLVHENMYRSMGWRFLSIGRSLERASSLASLLAVFTGNDAEEGSLDLAVEVADSTMSHRQRYAVSTNRATIKRTFAMVSSMTRAMSSIETLRGERDNLLELLTETLQPYRARLGADARS